MIAVGLMAMVGLTAKTVVEQVSAEDGHNAGHNALICARNVALEIKLKALTKSSCNMDSE